MCRRQKAERKVRGGVKSQRWTASGRVSEGERQAVRGDRIIERY